jgi:hypothetical protein
VTKMVSSLHSRIFDAMILSAPASAVKVPPRHGAGTGKQSQKIAERLSHLRAGLCC